MSAENDAYHADFSVISRSQIKLAIASPMEYYLTFIARLMDPPMAKRNTEIGSAVHEVLLENRDINDVIAVYPEECYKQSRLNPGELSGLNPKKAKEFRDANPFKVVLKEEDARIVMQCCMAVYTHDLGAILRAPGAVFEQPVFWTCPYSGLQMKCKPDFYHDMGDHILCYDLKTTEMIKPGEFKRVASNFAYWLQHIHYSTGLQEVFGKPVEYVFWAVETKFPYRIARYEYDESVLEAIPTYKHAVRALAERMATNQWTDAWTEDANLLSITPWELDRFGSDDEDLSYAGEEDSNG